MFIVKKSIMPKNIIYKDHAVIFDPNAYGGLDWHSDFVKIAIEECYDFLPDDWIIHHAFDDEQEIIIVKRKKYSAGYNLQPFWHFKITADPIDDNDNQWIVFDVILHTPHRLYRFQMP